jgi:serine/threonine protein kinase/tetratricopeptide (TPR) repeat protein
MAGSASSVESIFFAALARETPQERDAYVNEACGGDQELRGRVERLLNAHPKIGSFLQDNAAAIGATIDQALGERPGTLIGPYKLLEQIGEGGFGVVFMAEQQEPIRRKVALKVLKAGMDSKQVIARFEAERQALALMDHPNIARVLDAGTIDSEPRTAVSGLEEPLTIVRGSGRHYFVMELVKGIPITDYCDQNRLVPRERLELFVHVCQAVQHAHQKGIIHRDIKPSNVLVTLQDGKPLVKVIDFGIAKALGQQLTDKTLYTGFAQMIGTPLYMSPEQAALSNVDVDTRSDIYSLGVLLYELLTGTTPFDKERLKEVGFDEVRRIIREEEPPKPSTRISTLGQAASTVSSNRQSDPARLSRLFRGELDWIVMKSLEKDRNRRYETASACAADVQRYLKDEPVQACPPSAWYRFRKLLRRNVVAVTTAGVVAAALLVGTAVSWYFSFQAQERASEATAAQAQAQENLGDALDAVGLLSDIGAEKLESAPHLEQVRELLLEPALAYYQKFLKKNAGDPAMQREVGVAHRRLGDLYYSLERHAEAEQSFDKAVELLDKLASAVPGKPAYRLELARALVSRGRLLQRLGRQDAADQDFRRAVNLQAKLTAEHSDEPDYRHELARAHNALGVLLREAGHFGPAEQAFRKAVEHARQLPPVTKYRRTTSMVLSNLGALMRLTGRLDQAEQAYRDSIQVCESAPGQSSRERDSEAILATLRLNVGVLLMETSRFREAETEFRLGLKQAKKLVEDFPGVPRYRADVAGQQNNLAFVQWRLGKNGEAKKLFTQTVDLLKNLTEEYPRVPDYSHALGNTLNNLGMMFEKEKEYARARELLTDAVTYEEKALAISPKSAKYREAFSNHYTNLALVLRALKAPAAELDKAYRRAVDQARNLVADFPNVADYANRLGGALSNWAGWLVAEKKWQEARRLAQEAVTWQEKAIQANPKSFTYHEYLGFHYDNLAKALAGLKSPDREQTLRKAVAVRRTTLALAPAGHVNACQSKLGANLNDCAMHLIDRGALEEARLMLDEAIACQEKAVQADSKNPAYRLFLRNHCRNLGKTLIGLRLSDQAASALRQAVTVGEGLVKDHPEERDFRAKVADDYLELAELLRGGPQIEQTEIAYQEALRHWQQLVQECPRDVIYRSHLAGTYHNLAIWCATQGHLQKARPLLEASIPHERAAYDAEPERYRGLLVEHYEMLIKVLLELRDHAAAAREAMALVPVSGGDWKPCYQAARHLERCRRLAANDRGLTADQRKELTLVYTRHSWDLLAETARRNPDQPGVQRAMAAFLTTCPDPKYRDGNRAVELAMRAVQQDPENRAYWAVLGMAQYRAGNCNEAIKAIEKAREVKAAHDALFFLAMAYWQCADKARARQRYDEAVQWMQHQKPNDARIHSFRDEAAKLMGLKTD